MRCRGQVLERANKQDKEKSVEFVTDAWFSSRCGCFLLVPDWVNGGVGVAIVLVHWEPSHQVTFGHLPSYSVITLQ